MEYIKLGNSDLKVSRLCLGCMSFGEADQGQYQWTLDYESSKKIIDKAYDCGINFLILQTITPTAHPRSS